MHLSQTYQAIVYDYTSEDIIGTVIPVMYA